MDDSPGEEPSPNKPDQKLEAQQRMLRSLQAKMPSTMVNKISQTAPEMVGSRREVTALFVKIIDFSKAAREIGSENLYMIVDEVMHMLADVVYKYEGTIDKFSGDGFMALFGVPINHENDPERAVRAALDMQAWMERNQHRLFEQYHFQLRIRIGINTGPVIVGELGDNHHLEYTVVGNTVNLAAQLVEIAQPANILVSFSTYQRTRPILNYQTLPRQTIDDKAFITAYQALGVRTKPGQTRGLPGLEVPIVGRHEDLSQLTKLFTNTKKNRQCVIALCSGEAGIGKTRLISEFIKTLPENQALVYRGTCASYMRIAPYRVVADLLRSMIHVSEMDAVAHQKESLQRHLENNQIDLEETLPYLLHVLGLPQTDHVAEARLKLLDPDMLQRQTQSTLRKLFVAHAEISPLILIFDDLHWVDQASRDFFIFLIQSISRLPVFFIFIARNFTLDPMLLPLVDAVTNASSESIQLHLDPLSSEDTRLLADQLIQESTPNASLIKQQLASRAKGNPYYAEEIVRVLIDQGGIVKQNGHWRVTGTAVDLIKEIPGTLQDIILARFDRLPDEKRALLQKAAVIGQSFPVRLLEEIAKIDYDTLNEFLRGLVHRDYLVSSQFGIEKGYSFKHPLLQDVIYNTMLKRDQKNLHQLIGETIETGQYWLPAEQDEILAYHFTRSAQTKKAISYLLNSAEKAAQRFAHDSVIQHYRRAIEMMESEEDIAKEVYTATMVGLGQALKFSGNFDEAIHILEKVLEPVLKIEVPQTTGDTNLITRYADGLRELGDIRTREGKLDLAEKLLLKGILLLGSEGDQQYPFQWRRLVDRLAWVYFRQGKLEEAFNQADLALFNLETWELDDPITLASLSNTLGGIYWTRSRNIDAIRNVERSLKIYQSLNYAWGISIVLTNLGVLHTSMGKWLEAIANFEQADSIQREFGYYPERPTTLKNFGEVLICTGDHDQSKEKFELGRDIAHHLGMDIAEAYIEMGLCRLAIIEVDLEKAVSHIQRIEALLAPSIDQVNERVAQLLVLSAQVTAMQGELLEALSKARQGYEISEHGGFTLGKNEALRILGLIYTEMNRFDEAEEHLEKCAEFANNQKEYYRRAQALFGLGELYFRWAEKNPEIARQMVSKAKAANNEALDLFEMLGAKFDLYQAQMNRNLFTAKEHSLSSAETLDPKSFDQTASIRAQLGLPEGEWHQATVLFLQMVASPDADSELIFETIAILIPPLFNIFDELNGQVIRHQDGMTVVFGAPIAHEDDPERAIEAAIKVGNFYQEFYQQTELPLSIRMGVSMGRLIAGTVAAAGDINFIAAGEPINQAREAGESAPFSRVWVTEPIREATAYRYEYSTISQDLVVNLAGVNIHQLEGVREQIKPARGLMGLKTPFIGRKAEMKALIDISSGLENGEGGMIWIEGDPGIGKSRLMREFIQNLKSVEFQHWVGTCNIRRADYAFSLFTDLLADAFDLQSTYPVEKIYTIIDQKLDSWTKEANDLRPFIQLLCGVQPIGELGDQLLNLEPEQLRRQTFVALRKLVEVVAGYSPLIIMLDDIQWIDPVSADLLFFLTSLILDHPVLIIGAKRTGEISKVEETLSQIQQVHSNKTLNILVSPLSGDECNLLLEQFFASTAISTDLKNLIVQQSGGNPYFIEEFIRMLIEQDYLQAIRGKLEVNQSFEINALSIPSSLETLIRARVDGLQTPVRNLLQVASVIGQRFHLNLLEWISGQQDVVTRLSILQNRGMLQPTGEDGYWEFSHPLIETVVYNSVLKAQRKILHQRTASALEIQWYGSEEEHAEDLAYHFLRAEEREKALNYLVLSGERSAFRHANDAAVEYFEEAAKLIEKLPDTPNDLYYRIAVGLGEVYQFIGNFDASIQVLEAEFEREADHRLTPLQRAGLFRRIGETLLKKGELVEAIPYFDRGLNALGTVSGNQNMAEAAMLLERKGWNYFMEARLEEALQAGLSAQKFAEMAGNLRALAKINNLLGGIYYRQGELDQAVNHVQRAMEFWQKMGYTWGVAGTLSNLGVLEVGAGNWDEALLFFQKSLDLRREIGDVEGVVIAHNNLGTLAREKGDMDLAETHFRNCLSVAKTYQFTWQTANATMGVAQALMYQDQVAEAERVLLEGIALADEIGARDLSAEMGRTRAEIFLINNLLDEAYETAHKAALLAQEIGNSLMEAGAWRVASNCQLHAGQVGQAHKTLQIAWEALQKGEDELETGRINFQASKIYQALGEPEKTLEYRGRAKEIFSRLGAERDLRILEQNLS